MELELILDGLKKLVEGHFAAEEWATWWSENNASVKEQFSRGNFLKLKLCQQERADPSVVAKESQQVAMHILQRQDVSFAFKDRYASAVDEHSAEKDLVSAFYQQVLPIARSKFSADPNIDLVKSLYEQIGDEVVDSAWIEKKLSLLYTWIEEPPRWVAEIDWPIVDGRPAVFLFQYEIHNSSVAKINYANNRTVYLFGYREYVDEQSFELRHIVKSHSHVSMESQRRKPNNT